MKIQSLGNPPAGAHWSMGPNHMQRIGKADAARILAPHALPRMGYETTARDVPHAIHGRAFSHRLDVQNISGHFYLASCTDALEAWPALFGIDVQPCAEVKA